MMKYIEKYLVCTYGGEKTELCITIDGANSKIYCSKDNANTWEYKGVE